MNVLVTGGTGFLGSALMRRLCADGHTVTALGSREADLTQAEPLVGFANEQFDIIYHLAAWTQAGDFCLKHPGEQWVKNQQINTNVLAWWQRHQPQARHAQTQKRAGQKFHRDRPGVSPSGTA